jgi:nucleoside triphosphatase
MPIHLLLDWSGTLCDDVSTTLRATNSVIEALGGRPVDIDQYRREFRLPAYPFYAERIPRERLPSETEIDQRFAQALGMEAAPSLFPGAASFLARALEKGGTVRIVSSLPQDELERAVDAAGLRPRLSAIHGGLRDKTKALPLLIAQAGLAPDDCLMLGDMVHDLDAARAARVRACAVLHGYTAEAELRAHHPDEVWADLRQAEEWLVRHLSLDGRAWPIATVGGLAFRGDGRAYFVRTAKWSGTWGTPGGKIDYGEGHLEAFVREVREETGLEVVEPRLVVVQDAIEEPEFVRPRHFLLLNLVGRVSGGQERLNHESLEGGWYTMDEASELALNRPTRVLVDLVRQSGLTPWAGA